MKFKIVASAWAVCYNLSVKKLLALTTALCSLAIAANFGAASAFAEADGGLNEYPQDFTEDIVFESLDDYAVRGNKFAFLEKGVIFEYDGENFYGYQDDGIAVKAVYYADNGALCYGNDSGIFEHGTDEPVEITKETVTAFGYVYSDGENGLKIYRLGDDNAITCKGYSNPKEYGNTVYAVFENKLWTFGNDDPTTPVPLNLSYLDFSDTKSISTDGVTDSLKSMSAEKPQFVSLKSGAYMTKVSADKLDGKYFSVDDYQKDTVTAGKEITAETALLLATAGTDGCISMVMLCGEANSACYILRTADTSATDRDSVKYETGDLAATVTVADGYIYTAPYVCKSTQLVNIKAGDIVKVAGEVTKATNPELVRDFYKVEFTTADEETVTGYVPFGYVSPYKYEEKPPVETPDPDYDEGDLIKPVVLIIVVIALVLIAAGYLIFVATDGKIKKSEKSNKPKKL